MTALSCLASIEPFSDALDLNGESIFMYGYSATHLKSGRNVVGASAGFDSTHKIKAEYELFERALTLEAMQSDADRWPLRTLNGEISAIASKSQLFPAGNSDWIYSISNGVALGDSFVDSTQRATYELVERDILLRSWFCGFHPQPLGIPSFPGLEVVRKNYHCELSFHGSVEVGDLHISVCSFVGIPCAADKPLIIGYGAGPCQHTAAERSFSEFLQRLAFLWDEKVSENLEPTLPSADLHQNWMMTYEGKEKIHSWIRGNPYASARPLNNHWEDLQFATLHAQDGLWVTKAVSHEALPLTFGKYNPLTKEKSTGLHPIS